MRYLSTTLPQGQSNKAHRDLTDFYRKERDNRAKIYKIERMRSFKFFIGLILTCAAATPQQYVISTIAGGAPPPTPITATQAYIGNPTGVAVDLQGNTYFTTDLNCVFKVDRNGTMTLLAGNSRAGYSGDGGPATVAQLNNPVGIATDSAGNIFIEDHFAHADRIRKISMSGVITTVAGGGLNSAAAGGPATEADLDGSQGTELRLTIDENNNIFIGGLNRILKVTPAGIITIVAGTGTAGFSGDGGPAISAQLNAPIGVAVDKKGNLYIADYLNNRIRKVSATGIITTVAGNGASGAMPSGDGGPALNASITPYGVAIDDSGNLFVLDSNATRKISPNGIINSVVGISGAALAIDSSGNVLLANLERILKVSPDGAVTTVAGNNSSVPSGDGEPATNAQFGSTGPLAVDNSGNVFVQDVLRHTIRKISSSGIVTTVAGGGLGFLKDGSPATSGATSGIGGIAVDNNGTLFFTDLENVRRVSPGGTTTTVTTLQIGRDDTATGGISLGPGGDLYIAVWPTGTVWKVSPNGSASIVAGTGTPGYSGDGGMATLAQLYYPTDVAVDTEGNLFIADKDNGRIRKVTPDGRITTIAGGGSTAMSTKAVLATNVKLVNPSSVTVDSSGNILVADSYGVSRLSPDGTILAISDYQPGLGYVGDGGPSTGAILYQTYLRADGAGNVYVSDPSNNAVRLLRPNNQPVFISAVVDAASERISSVSSGKIVVIYGAGLGPETLVSTQPSGGAFGNQAGGTSVSFNGVAAPILYSSATQLGVIAPYSISGNSKAQVTVSYEGQVSAPFDIAVAPAAPSFFSLNSTGAGQIAAVNTDGSINDAVHPVKSGGYISLYATGEGQTNPAGLDGALALTTPYPHPVLPTTVTIGGIAAKVLYAGAAPTEVAGLIQIVVQIPPGVQPSGYVPVVLQVGDTATVDGACWIAVSTDQQGSQPARY